MEKLGIMAGSNYGPATTRVSSCYVIEEILENMNYSFVMGPNETGVMKDIKDRILESSNLHVVGIAGSEALIKARASEKTVVTSSFARTEVLYNESDIILFLPGGIGTISELVSMVNEKFENGDDKKIIVYNEKNVNDKSSVGAFDNQLKDMDRMFDEGYTSCNLRDFIIEVNSNMELFEVLESDKKKGEYRK